MNFWARDGIELHKGDVIELSAEYLEIARKRLDAAMDTMPLLVGGI